MDVRGVSPWTARDRVVVIRGAGVGVALRISRDRQLCHHGLQLPGIPTARQRFENPA